MLERVEALIAQYVRPLVEADGGTVRVLEASETKVVVGLSGSCLGCPGRPFTTTRVIEPALRKAFGAALEVEVRTSADLPDPAS